MIHVFVDTSAFFAQIVIEDERHEPAVAAFRRATAEGWSLVTTNLVVAETHALLVNRARNGPQIGLRFVESVRAGLCRVERVTGRDEERADAILKRHFPRGYSLCDAVSFAVIARLKIRCAIAFDRHFSEQKGFTTIP